MFCVVTLDEAIGFRVFKWYLLVFAVDGCIQSFLTLRKIVTDLKNQQHEQ